MLGGSKSNIYVTVTRDDAGGSERNDDHVFSRAQAAWFLSIEPHKHHVPGMPHRTDPELIHISAVQKDGSYSVEAHSIKGDPVVRGNILVAENAKTTPDQVQSILKEKLVTGPSKLPSEQTSEDEPEHWIRKALHVLQAQHILESFDVGEFMTFAHGYAANRAEHEAPAMVAYPRLNKDHEHKAKKHGFWVDYPQASKVNPRSRIEGDSNKYGNLM
ncbi:hypothetical protein DOTSEDRAFT_70154 [Dothistroma septosporum NZE10]|uniref:Uncharacterized protein n=1 Tax=Dothistroma septosporum (strain NZE10 / CBS 128990) TaxID=675120 RepID=N1PRJ8_DOTSN|nr:hypothetical protein DOTSEDRAFT_70154 [Dothistroma septosporum NZE10]